MQNFSHYMESDSDSHPNCQKQEWDWNRNRNRNQNLLCEYKQTISPKEGTVEYIGFALTSFLYVSALNEHSPAFTANPYSFTVSEDAAIETTVGSLTATDDDDGTDGQYHSTLKIRIVSHH